MRLAIIRFGSGFINVLMTLFYDFVTNIADFFYLGITKEFRKDMSCHLQPLV